ncbi:MULTISPECIES: hypothetical protein [Marinobacter]|jgi:hypothetical protein|uniref:hypothetical protein n=2 Tax=Gammaproteobacteria TaxID=1236 RepID=UPI000948F5B5|nr:MULTISPECIES: hypothetical protein [Marinobacter]MCZ4284439.1 hypothetical protein [Marinobacter salarius]MDM8180725.1 hypothetical protein [Marinobacter salarius]OLF84078.1 hypothetical protein AWH63_04185 [Marinobacter sp. C18]RUT77292.1 hypothetical protein EHM94_19955 [Marinobacter sp. NP-6]VVT17208.1 conserved membrane hypothetical protein [Marinobacter salarius]|tara:strand:- start:2872 stop:3357 length:486 start_codon:yes stop_codon:yes gene_type:complete
MIAYFFPFIAVVVLTVLASLSVEVARQRDELLPLLNFEPFVYVLFLGAGVSLIVSHRSRVPEILGTALVVPFSGALTGWGAGLTIVELLSGHWQNVPVGIALSVLMAAITLAPVLVVGHAASFTADVRGRLFRKPLHVWLTHFMAISLIVGGLFGLWSVYG